jgi:malonate-semialdehyde dehydrogenase (acetylating) / methylmalonate-semialdehyde dehydrogenase
MNAPQAFESKEDIGHYVNGSVVNPRDGRFADVYNPAKVSVARRVALASRKEVDTAVAVAQKAFETWSQTSPLRRSRILFKYIELLNDNRDELAAIITGEYGKVFANAQGEVTRGIEIVEFATGIPELLKGNYTEQV